jgi:hypothetical protein
MWSGAGVVILATSLIASCGSAAMRTRGVWRTDSGLVPLGLNVIAIDEGRAVHEFVIFGEQGLSGGVLLCRVALQPREGGDWDHPDLAPRGLFLRFRAGSAFLVPLDGSAELAMERCSDDECGDLISALNLDQWASLPDCERPMP